MKLNAEDEFHTLFVRAQKQVEESLGLTDSLTVPRRVGHQARRNMVPGDTPEELHYRRNVFIPFLEYVRLWLRFKDKPMYTLQLFVP